MEDFSVKKFRVRDVLSHHIGKCSAITRRELWIMFPDISDRLLRKMVEELIVHDQEPIASSDAGYYYIATRQELTEAKEYLDEKAEAIAVRKNVLDRNYALKNPAPLDLFPADKQFVLVEE